jgi:uncharacterized protein YbjT (DUF2867 family)
VFLVVGATGYLGGEICRLLRDVGRPVRAFVRATSDPETVERLRGFGAELVEGDLRDPLSLERACDGTRAVVTTATTVRSRQPGDSFERTDKQGQLDLVEAAAAAGVERLLFVSFTPLPYASPLGGAKRAVEERLRGNGIPYTILRPGHFMEVWLGPAFGFDVAAGEARVLGSGDAKINWISVGDVARTAVAALDDPGAAGETIEFAADYRSPNEVVEIAREVTGRQLHVERVPREALELEAQRAAGGSDLEETFAALMLATADGYASDQTGNMRRWVDRPTMVRDFLAGYA